MSSGQRLGDTMEMKAGKYYVGDLCYVLGDSAWQELVSLMFPEDREKYDYSQSEGVFKLSDGRIVAVYGTAHGDGTYTVCSEESGRAVGAVGVDSGTVGCVLVDSNLKESGFCLGKVWEFDSPFYVESNGSTLVFGELFVETE